GRPTGVGPERVSRMRTGSSGWYAPPLSGGGVGYLPVPVRRMVSGTLRPLTGKFRTPVRGPAALGAKRMATLQLAFGASNRLEQWSLLMAKSAPLTPEIVT